MSVPTHFRVTVRGTFGATDEIWVTGFHFQRAAGQGPDAGLDDIDEGAMTSAIAGFFGGTTFTSALKTTDWRAYQIGTNKKMEGNGPLLHEFTTPVAGTGGAQPVWPSNVALCVTTISDTRGPAQRGRFYLPPPQGELGTDWRMSLALVTTYEATVRSFLKAMSDAIDIPDTLESSDMVNVSDRPVGSAGTIQSVDHIEIGRVCDTVQSRRRQLLEDRFVGPQIDW